MKAVFSWHVLILPFVLVAAGCGAKKVAISGTVTRDGQPLVWKSDDSLLIVTFAPVDHEKDRDVYPGVTDRQKGTFTVRGIPPGQYIVSVQQMDPLPGSDLLQYKFELHNSPIRKEVTHDGQVIDIDLPKDLPPGGKSPPANAIGKKNPDQEPEPPER